MCPSAPRVCSEPGGQMPVLSLSLDLITYPCSRYLLLAPKSSYVNRHARITNDLRSIFKHGFTAFRLLKYSVITSSPQVTKQGMNSLTFHALNILHDVQIKKVLFEFYIWLLNAKMLQFFLIHFPVDSKIDIPHWQNHACWWPGDARSLVLPEHSSLCTRRVEI